MRIPGRSAGRRWPWPVRHSAYNQVGAEPMMPAAAKDQWRQPTGRELTEGKQRGQDEEKLTARPGDWGRLGAEPEHIRALELDQEQVNAVLAALEDAAALRREAIGNCPDCRSAGERVCTDHQGSWETAKEYDSLRWHPDSSYPGGRAGLQARPADHQTIGRNNAPDYCNEASDYQPDREAGE